MNLQKFVNLPDVYNNTALIEASKRNFVSAARILLENLGADRDFTNHMKHTALSVAGMNGHLSMVKLLVEQGSNVLIENCEQNNCLDNAVSMEKLEAVEYLESFVYEAKLWRAKNCLVKLMLNRRKAKKITNISEGVFREIIKYAGV